MVVEVQALKITETIKVGDVTFSVSEDPTMIDTEVVRYSDNSVSIRYISKAIGHAHERSRIVVHAKLIWQKAQQQQIGK